MVGVSLYSSRAALERGNERVDIGDEEIGGAHELHIEAGIEHVGGGHALVDKARLGPDDLGEMGEKGDDVVLDFALDLFDPRDVEFGRFAVCPDRLGGLLRDHAELGHGIGGMGFDLEPDAKPRFRRPDRRHLRDACNAGWSRCLSSRQRRRVADRRDIGAIGFRRAALEHRGAGDENIGAGAGRLGRGLAP